MAYWCSLSAERRTAVDRRVVRLLDAERTDQRPQRVSMKRIIEIPGAINLRDFGGYETSDGRRVRSGVLFRSGMLAQLTADGQSALRDLGIGVICDLRRDAERTLEPTPFPVHDPRQIHVSIDPDHAVKLREALEFDRLDVAGRV